MLGKCIKASASQAYKGRVIWLFTKYQLLTKGIFAFGIYPLYSLLIRFLLEHSGRTVLSSGDYWSFLLSLDGLGIFLSTIILMALLVALDINSFIIMSALIQEGRIEMTMRQMLFVSLKSLRRFISPTGVLLMVYISIIFPLIGLGITVSPMKNFQIPNFITSVIYDNPLYLSLYFGLVLLLTYTSYRYIFTFHYALIKGDSLKTSLASSKALTKKYGFRFLKDLFLIAIKRSMVYLLPIFVLFFVGLLGIFWLGNSQIENLRFYLFFLFLALYELVTFLVFLFVPLSILVVTDLFYTLNKEEGQSVSLQVPMMAKRWRDGIHHRIKFHTKIFVGLGILSLLVINATLSSVFTAYFDELFRNPSQIQLVAHRAGGDLGAENTVQGINEAIKKKVNWTEIDVQRTKDGAYVLNHDQQFKRLTGETRSSKEMTLAEIKQLRVKNTFDTNGEAQPVPTIEEVVAAAKGKIGLFIELKGETADKKMVDEMVQLIKKEKIEQQAVLLSLDYSLIEYIEQTYPEIQSGYLYYFAIGKTTDLKGDYLIMEEREASPEKVETLKATGKKVVVWTVNTEESIDHFINSDVDGIITDYIPVVQEALRYRDRRSDLDIIVDVLFGK